MKAALLGACLAAFAAAGAAAQPAPRPNIIFILADDLGYGDLGSYGQRIIQTPNLDRLAAEGIRFTQFYAGSTVCAPSRSVLMTGRHMGHTRVRGNAGAGNYAAQTLAAGDVTVARVLKDAGYATALVGKWGLGEIGSEGEPNRHGFDEFYGVVNQTHAHNHYPDFVWRNREKVPLPNVVTPVGTTPGAGYATARVQYANDLFFDEARAFIDRSRDRPFFLFLSLTVPHANNERARALGDGQEVPDYGPYASKDWADPLKGQAAMITRMDGCVGELLAQLKRLGIDDRTLVVFTSDNGPHKEGGPAYDPDFFDANGPFSGIKRSLTDGGIRVPFIARWPKAITPGGVSPHVGYFGDMMATFAELAGAEAARRPRQCQPRAGPARARHPGEARLSLLGVLRERIRSGRPARGAMEGHPPEVTRGADAGLRPRKRPRRNDRRRRTPAGARRAHVRDHARGARGQRALEMARAYRAFAARCRSR